MLLSFLFFCTLLPIPGLAFMEPCTRPTEIFAFDEKTLTSEYFTVVMQGSTKLFKPYSTHSLAVMMLESPCLEIQYNGTEIDQTTQLVIYGTCDFKHMFRFVAQSHSPGKCSNVEIAFWNHSPMNDCMPITAEDRFSFDFRQENNATFGYLSATDASFTDFLIAFVYSRALFDEYEYPWLLSGSTNATDHEEIPDCDCLSKTEDRNKVSFKWSERCHHNREPQGNFPVIVVCVVVGLVLLLVTCCSILT